MKLFLLYSNSWIKCGGLSLTCGARIYYDIITQIWAISPFKNKNKDSFVLEWLAQTCLIILLFWGIAPSHLIFLYILCCRQYKSSRVKQHWHYRILTWSKLLKVSLLSKRWMIFFPTVTDKIKTAELNVAVILEFYFVYYFSYCNGGSCFKIWNTRSHVCE